MILHGEVRSGALIVKAGSGFPGRPASHRRDREARPVLGTTARSGSNPTGVVRREVSPIGLCVRLSVGAINAPPEQRMVFHGVPKPKGV